jgi:hypothetical protein
MAVIFTKRMDGDKSSMEGYCYNCAKEKGINPLEVLAEQSGMTEEQLSNMNDISRISSVILARFLPILWQKCRKRVQHHLDLFFQICLVQTELEQMKNQGNKSLIRKSKQNQKRQRKAF